MRHYLSDVQVSPFIATSQNPLTHMHAHQSGMFIAKSAKGNLLGNFRNGEPTGQWLFQQPSCAEEPPTYRVLAELQTLLVKSVKSQAWSPSLPVFHQPLVPNVPVNDGCQLAFRVLSLTCETGKVYYAPVFAYYEQGYWWHHAPGCQFELFDSLEQDDLLSMCHYLTTALLDTPAEFLGTDCSDLLYSVTTQLNALFEQLCSAQFNLNSIS